MNPIDGDKLIKTLRELCGEIKDPTAKIGFDALCAFVQSGEIAVSLDDLRPKGRWEPVDARYSRCTNCKKERNVRTQIAWTFCPSCGADMRGGGEDER